MDSITDVFYTINSTEITKPLRVVMLSDTHNSNYYQPLAHVKALKPDIIAIVGDTINRHTGMHHRALKMIKALSEIAPVYFSFGNHEIKYPILKSEDFEKAGATVLDNGFIRYSDELVIGGYTPFSEPYWIPSFEAEKGFKLLLCHHPEYYEKYLKNRNIDLILSGHAHGGQWRFFGHGVYSPGQGLFPKYTCGLYDNKLIVGTGLVSHNGLIPRINNPRQIVVVDIKKSSV